MRNIFSSQAASKFGLFSTIKKEFVKFSVLMFYLVNIEIFILKRRDLGNGDLSSVCYLFNGLCIY